MDETLPLQIVYLINLITFIIFNLKLNIVRPGRNWYFLWHMKQLRKYEQISMTLWKKSYFFSKYRKKITFFFQSPK
jgi:hypothetical protein